MSNKKLKPGTPAPSKGKYDEINKGGTRTGRTVEMEQKNDTLPPTQKKRQIYKKQ